MHDSTHFDDPRIRNGRAELPTCPSIETGLAPIPRRRTVSFPLCGGSGTREQSFPESLELLSVSCIEKTIASRHLFLTILARERNVPAINADGKLLPGNKLQRRMRVMSMLRGAWRAKLGVMAVVASLLFLSAADAPAEVMWGPRAGVGLDPEQLIIGLQVRPDPIAEDVYIQPNVELGFGDDHVIISVAVPVHYHFDTDSSTKPYAGGGFSFGVDSVDRDNGDDSDFEVSIDLIGGLEWMLDSGNIFFTEMKLGIGELHTMEFMVGLHL
jgi:hypothetical protein